MIRKRSDVVAVCSASVLTVGTAMIFHELGHIAAGRMAGGTPRLLTATEVRGEFASLSHSGLVALGLSGSLVNLLLCLLGWWVLARRSISAELRLNAWFCFAFNGLIAATKMTSEPLAGFGDWMTVLGWMPGNAVYRLLVAAAGVAALILLVKRSRVALARLLGDETAAGRRAEALQVVLTGAAAAAVLVLGEGLAAPEHKTRAMLLSLGVLGPFVPMLFVARALPAYAATTACAPARATWPWVVGAGITAAVLWFVVGPGVAL
jgi:hypothetical protein